MKTLYDFLNENYVSQSSFTWDEVMYELRHVLGSEPDILFMPSCGSDVYPISYFNKSWAPEIEGPGPDVIIRCDAMLYESVCRPPHGLFHVLDSATGIRSNGTEKRPSIFISKLNIPDKYVWVLEIFNTPNEDMLSFFLDNNIKIRYVYSKCDGIMTGIGLHDINSIPTIYYTYLYELLQVGTHISEYIYPEITTYVSETGRHKVWKNALLHLADRLQEKHVQKAIYAAVSDDFKLPDTYEMAFMDHVKNGVPFSRLCSNAMLIRKNY
jgi:hypothetical protein